MKNKHGFMTVYACFFFITLLSVTLIFVEAAKESALQSKAAALSRLWAQSVLAEYDLNLQQRYHIFGFYGNVPMVKEKLQFYSNETFLKKRNIWWNVSDCSLYQYSLCNVDVLKEQLTAAGKFAAVSDGPKPEQEIQPVKDHVKGKQTTIFEDLPSSGSEKSISVSSLAKKVKTLTSIKNLVREGSDGYFEQLYILSHFKHQMDDRQLGETYFRNETEYLICGKKTDERNRQAIRNRIIGLREIMNLTYLNGNEKSRNLAFAAAEILTPGPAAVATQQTLLSLWALAESVNDYHLLMEGYHVAFMKTEKTWAVDLESAMNNETESCIFTGVDEGENYEDYLRCFLWFMDERVRTLRIMDLIQINMRWLYYEGFQLKDYYGGVNFTLSVNGEKHHVEEMY